MVCNSQNYWTMDEVQEPSNSHCDLSTFYFIMRFATSAAFRQSPILNLSAGIKEIHSDYHHQHRRRHPYGRQISPVTTPAST
jgi:hypothetical protein